MLLLVLVLIVAGGFSLLHLQLSENAEALIPDRDPQLLRQFQLLQQSPMTHKLLVVIEAEESRDRARLTEAAAVFATRFNRAGVGRLQTRLQIDLPGLLQQLVVEMPQRFPAAKLPQLADELSEEEIGLRLQEARDELLSPVGLGSKVLIRTDPLRLRQRLFDGLAYTNLLGRGQFRGGYLWSEDGKGLLLVGKTDIQLTDVRGAAALEQAARAAAAELPPGIKADLLCGQRYTLANAMAIKHDLRRIGLLVSAGLLLVFGLFLRDWRALPVLLLPLAGVVLALGLVLLSGVELSGITLGFGAVVLGVALDYGLHVFFALRHRQREPEQVLAELSRPLLCGALTSIGAFVVLLSSALPVQRQLGWFAALGLLLALLLALLVLPLLLVAPPQPLEHPDFPTKGPGRRNLLLAGWGLLLLVALAGAIRVRINGDLRQISLVPPQLAATEQRLRQGWGDLRGRAMLLLEGEEEEVRQQNEVLFSRLRDKLSPGDLVSLAPLLPSRATRTANRAAWSSFWHGAAGGRIADELRRQAGEHGFAPTAFAPFFASFEAQAPVERPLPACFEPLLGNLEQRNGEKLQILTLAADRPELATLLQDGQLDMTLLSPRLFRAELSGAVKDDFFRLAPCAGVMVLLLTALLLRRARLVIAALAPVISGVVAMFGIMGWAGIAFNLFNAVATVLVIGLTIDYGIFMVWRRQHGGDRVTDRAVLVSGLTTLAGFGSLALASHPALFAIGISVLIGIGAAVPTALWLVPALVPERVLREEK
ncbi:MMPL family transporter [Geothermobacter hydrogeniphilus]|uniref:MMPL family transporter n=1 Tax=Geothermobacter hydrogeniphilus TaxID=1969733 RepID=UPI001304B8B3|nr:MMPL family transporter [Geothermobacter hydrogeniphilus]